jgi:signal transduction histidine kinase
MSNRVTNSGLVITGAQSDEMGELTALLADIEGFTVETVPAWDLADHLPTADPDALVVVDHPPASDGVDIFAEVRGSGATLPVVLVGSAVSPDRVETAISAGVTDYITTGDDTQVAELAARLRAHIRNPVLDGFVEARRWERTIGSLAHDMKNPLNVVSGRLELLDVEATHADAIGRSITRLESLIDEVSRVATVSQPCSDPDTVSLSEAAQRVWTELATDGATLAVQTEKTVESDAEAVKTVLRRLFENAVAHGGADVAVTVGDTDDGFYVADDGPGVSDDAKAQVCEQGYGTAREGEGYGLFVASRAAAASGWRITVGQSDAGGARFDIQYR